MHHKNAEYYANREPTLVEFMVTIDKYLFLQMF